MSWKSKTKIENRKSVETVKLTTKTLKDTIKSHENQTIYRKSQKNKK